MQWKGAMGNFAMVAMVMGAIAPANVTTVIPMLLGCMVAMGAWLQ